jgi:signal peptidase I
MIIQSGGDSGLQRPTLNRFRSLSEWGELALLIFAVYVFVNLVSVRFIVQGPSMETTFFGGDYLVVNRVKYLVNEPERGDIVVFHFPADEEQDYIKRIIGIPGDIIEIRETNVFINGMMLSEPYVLEDCTPMNCPDNRWELGVDEYFVLGDNRNRSSDSRSFREPVQRQHIIGEVVFRYWPLSTWGIVTDINFPSE